MRLQIRRVGEHDGAIDGVLQLTDIAGPVEGGEAGQRFRRSADDGFTFLDIEASDEAVDQGGDVLLPLAQARRLDGEDVQPVEQILAEAALRHGLGQVAVGGGDDPHIHLHRAFGPDGVDLALLQGAQQLDLDVQRQLAHLVEEQGAAVRLLELAQVLVGGAREAALLVAEQDALHEVLGDGAAVHRHERLAGPVRGAMDRAGDDFLADPAFAGDQDRNA